MRIIAGKYKHKRFDVPHSFKARPTTDFAKEGLFNILESRYVDFRTAPTALDLFAGTGSISLELISRGCSKVVSIEKDFDHYKFINKICKELGDRNWKVMCRDVFSETRKLGMREKYDFVFADPPYTLPNIANIPQLVMESGVLKEEGLLVLEHGKKNEFSDDPHFVDHRCYGSVNFSFFIPSYQPSC